jgi:hypothetical protein
MVNSGLAVHEKDWTHRPTAPYCILREHRPKMVPKECCGFYDPQCGDGVSRMRPQTVTNWTESYVSGGRCWNET